MTFWCDMNHCLLSAAMLLSGWGLLAPSPSLAQSAQGATRGQAPGEITQGQATVESGTKAPSSYVLGPDDQIAIHALDLPDISDKPQRLDPNGDIRLPLIGRIHAGGMTVEELENELIEKLKAYLHEPDVSVA